MADQLNEQAQAPEAQKLDQAAIDAAMATMKAGDVAEEAAPAEAPSEARATTGSEENPDSADGAPSTETATLSNSGDTFSESVDDGHQELDAAIAALQAEDPEEEPLFQQGDSASPDDRQAVIDATVAAMQTDNSEPAPAGAAVDAMSAHGTGESADAGQWHLSTDELAGGEEQPTGDEMHADRDPDRIETTEPAAAESDAESDPQNPNTFSDIGQGELDDPSGGGSNDFRSLDDENTATTEAVAACTQEATDAGAKNSGSPPIGNAFQVPAELRGAEGPSGAAEEGLEAAGTKKKTSGLLLVLIAAAALVGLAAFFGRDLYSTYIGRFWHPSPPSEAAEIVPAPPAQPPSPLPHENSQYESYYTKIREVARLRADLLAKKEDIDELKQFYRDGISELEEEIQQEAATRGVKDVSGALAIAKIKLDLETIQRRRAYVEELDKPSHWLHQGSEELLFLSRRAEIDLRMSAVASGIELTKHMRDLNAGLQKYRISPERLAIDVAGTRLQPLEEIWNAVAAQDNAVAVRAVAHGDPSIIEEICDGQTGRIAELSTLTIKGAKCLAQLDAPQLILNNLTSMSPVAAKYLSGWGGRWLCLNGVRRLDPDVARNLFRWEGDWMSLNGLADFPAQIGELLLSWEGRQLELMGLVPSIDHPERIGLKQLAEWESAGGKLFVPGRIRAAIDRIK